MAQLSTIISSILRDMVSAQHQANLYAMTLKDMYSSDGQLNEFALPAVALGEMELCIQYGITDSLPETELYEINPPALQDVIRNISKACARLLLDNAVPAFKNALPDKYTGNAEPLDTLENDMEKRNGFSAFLSHKIRKALQKEYATIIKEDGSIEEETLLQIVMNVGEESLLNHDEVREVLDRNVSNDHDEQVKTTMRTAVKQNLSTLLKDMNVKRKQLMPSVDVCVSSEELAALPNGSVHTLRLKVSPNNINMFLKDE
ncbi:MAG: hypothetical protein K2H97_08925 [Prevotella sp.]|nr:hypothetical protein [Prevotella sp.]